MLAIKDRDLVIPGQLLGEGIGCQENCFLENSKVYSSVQGMVRVSGNRVKVIPSSGKYLPKAEDLVIGIVTDVQRNRWLLDIDSPCLCVMEGEGITRRRGEDLGKYYGIGDLLSAKIFHVNEVNECQLIRPWKLEGGVVINVDPKRIPRVVGKKRSMLNIIKDKTGCRIVVGQNGRIWMEGRNIKIAELAIRRIEKEAQSQGLTNRIMNMLNEELKGEKR